MNFWWSTTMTNRQQQRADKVVAAFKELIGDDACAQISATHFEDLTQMISTALGEERRAAAEMMERVAARLRSETGLNELGM
jgi:hypothetical protein